MLSMSGDVIQHKGLIAVAVGAGIMISSAGLFIYQLYFGERKRQSLKQEIDQLETSVIEIQRELSALRMAVESLIDESGTTSFQEIDDLLESSSKEDVTKAYGFLLDLLEQEENDELMWRAAVACCKMSMIYAAEGSEGKKRDFIFQGVEFGKNAVSLNSSNWQAHKWYAVCIGKRSQLLRVKDRIQDGYTFKEHLDKALELNKEDAMLHHLLGRFNFELSSLSWFEKKVASTIFGTIPHGSYEKAIESLLEAERLASTDWKENKLMIAKCYAAQRNFNKTLEWLKLANEVPSKNAEDILATNEIEKLLLEIDGKNTN